MSLIDKYAYINNSTCTMKDRTDELTYGMHPWWYLNLRLYLAGAQGSTANFIISIKDFWHDGTMIAPPTMALGDRKRFFDKKSAVSSRTLSE